MIYNPIVSHFISLKKMIFYAIFLLFFHFFLVQNADALNFTRPVSKTTILTLQKRLILNFPLQIANAHIFGQIFALY